MRGHAGDSARCVARLDAIDDRRMFVVLARRVTRRLVHPDDQRGARNQFGQIVLQDRIAGQSADAQMKAAC
jgi:hypothetical protein